MTIHDATEQAYKNGYESATNELKSTIKRLEEENNNFYYKLVGVMHFVDKWLDGDELKQDEICRADTMREKTLRIVEEKQAEINRLKAQLDKTE